MPVISASDPSSAVARIDLGALRHNLDVLRRRAEGLEIIAVVKANAYGHGLLPVTHYLASEGVSRFAVATLNEGVALREAGIDARILVFAPPLPEHLPVFARHDLDVTVGSPDVAEAVVRVAATGLPLRAHVKVDTGMGRVGLEPDQVVGVIRSLERTPGVSLAGFWTHFASADQPNDPFTARQWALFRTVLDDLGGAPAPVHVANTGGLFTHPVALDPALVSGIRLGISLYGIYDPPEETAPDTLRPVMTLASRLTQIKTVAAGTPVSYGATWNAPRETRIGTIAVGYADGYRRAFSNRAHVGVAGVPCPVAGRVCMDMIMVDLGPEGVGPPACVGDTVVLFGNGGPSVFDLARLADTITYEIVCGITARVTRRVIDPA